MLSLLSTQSQYTPLMLAASAGDYKCVEHLLKWKADTNIHGHVSYKDYKLAYDCKKIADNQST